MKDKYKVILFFCLASLAMSCGSKKKLTTVDIQKEKITYVLPSENKILVETLCDSLGNPIQLQKVLTNAAGTTIVSINGNSLEIHSLNDTIQIKKDVFKDKFVEKETVKYRTNWKTILFFSLVILIFIIFPGIPLAIRTMAIKLIRGF